MHQFARTIGYLTLFSGAILLLFPEPSRRLMQVREEFAHLSPGALRLLGGWYFLTGALLVAVTRPPVEVRAGEAIAPELRKAA